MLFSFVMIKSCVNCNRHENLEIQVSMGYYVPRGQRKRNEKVTTNPSFHEGEEGLVAMSQPEGWAAMYTNVTRETL